MQFADLMKLFREGQNEGRKRGYVTQGACDAEGVTAIVRALRDEMQFHSGMAWERLNEILGDAGEKVAEMPDLPTRTVQLTGVTKSRRPDIQFEPATDAAPAFYAGQDPKISLNTDAAPAVCEWRGSKDGQLAYMGCTKRLEWTYDRRKCPSCGKSIEFKEANHG